MESSAAGTFMLIAPGSAPDAYSDVPPSAHAESMIERSSSGLAGGWQISTIANVTTFVPARRNFAISSTASCSRPTASPA